MNEFKHAIMMSLQPFINRTFNTETQKLMSKAVQGVFDRYATPDVSVIAVNTKIDSDKRVTFDATISVRTNIHL